MSKLNKLMSYIRAASPYRSVSNQIIDLVLHKLYINIAPADYYRFEFYKGGKTWEEKSRYVAFSGSRYWPFENNEFKYTTTLTNKYIQKHLLIGFGLPTPRLLATLGSAMEIRSEEQFFEFLAGIDRDIVLKSISSAGGSDVWVLTNRGGKYFSANDAHAQEGLWKKLQKGMDRGFLIEERVRNTG